MSEQNENLNQESGAVDFSNPDSIASALENTNTPVEGAAKVKKAPKPKMITCPNCAHVFELPKGEGIRGQLNGIPLEEMTADQLKIEYRNATSVQYKTIKAQKDASKATERVEKVKAAMAAMGIEPSSRTSAPMDAAAVAAAIKSGAIKIEDLEALLNGGTAE